ncbi:hypothetical protein [Mangrovibacterium lignilyticum]|uniref:hypothetical protein n=1 Tax=Mangrovibacterium lignilyticum TaxID=2668052 RepID=UPI0013CFA4DE|nr:hypothetical protein [Mangrovibacterium lignilyticum]
MTFRSCFLLLLLLHISWRLAAQDVEKQNRMLQLPIYFSAINPEHAVGIFALDLPFYFPADDGVRDQFAVSYSMGNTWHPQAWMYYPQNLTKAQQRVNRELYMTWRPTYFESVGVQSKVKTYQSDGVLQHFRFAWIRKWKERNSFILNMNVHLLSGGSSPLHYFVSDRFIETFHTRFAIDDNYGRKLYPFNRASIQFIDEDGNKYRKEQGEWFTSVLDAHYYRQVINRNTEYAHFQLNIGGHLSVPFNSLHRYLIPGMSAGFRLDKLSSPQTSVTLAFDAGLTMPTFLKTGEGVKAIDQSFRETIKMYFGGNIKVSKESILQFGLMNNFQGALMKGSNNDRGQVDYDEIGIRFLHEGDTWEGEDISQEFWLAKITPASLYYFSYKAFLVLGWQRKSRQFNFYIGEDFFFINNAPDFQIGFEYVLPLSRKK